MFSSNINYEISQRDWYGFQCIAVRQVAKPMDQKKKLFHTSDRQRLGWMFFVCPKTNKTEQPQHENLTYKEKIALW